MQRSIGILLMHGETTDRRQWLLVIEMWWRALVVRRDLGAEELFFVRNGRSKLFSDFRSFAVLGIRFIWRK